MADLQNITIKFKPDGDKELILAVKRLDAATKKLQGQTSVYEKELRRLNVTEQKHSTNLGFKTKQLRLQSGAFATLRSNLLLYSFALGLANRAIVSFVEKSAEVEDLAKGFRDLGSRIGLASGSMQKFRDATKGTAKDADILKAANNAMMLGVVKSEEEMASLFETSKKLGTALGLDTKTAIDSLVTGMGRQSRMMLDNLGIIVKSDEAYKSYADKIGVTVSALTEQQKKLAFNEEVLRKAKEITDQLTDSQLSTKQQLDRMTVATDNLSMEMGQVLTPIVLKLADALTGIDKHLNAEELRKVAAALSGIALAYGTIRLAVKAASLAVLQFNKRSIAMGLALMAAGSAAVFLDEKFGIFGGSLKEIDEEMLKLNKELEETGENFVQLGEEIAEVINWQQKAEEVELFGGAVLGVANQYNELQKAQFEQFKQEELARINSIRSERKRAKEMEKFEKEAQAQERKMRKRNQTAAIAETTISTSAAIMKTYEKYGATPTGIALAVLMGIQGAMQIATIKAQKFETGGMVGGRRHSQGGTLIEAERGEFVMSRSAVESVGLETMNRINQGGGAGVNVSFSGNVMSDDFVENEAIPKIKEAIRRGADIGVS